MKIALLHAPNKAKVEWVKREMEDLGSPAIKAVWMEGYGMWFALEGTHRLTAAHDLGMVPEIDPVEWSEEVTTEEIGVDFPDDVYTIAELVGRIERDLTSGVSGILEFS